eukprot:TRINITY_DN2196_c0_g1_i1.p1 TRINITY_DN2196_c0_g1~~TRINITY_DN2196_c0_g1_i1.p1  ORF type:complete len:265 (+),score=82.90 TRINITY_DN2196_c0_g1_i1:438-1232(+)
MQSPTALRGSGAAMPFESLYEQYQLDTADQSMSMSESASPFRSDSHRPTTASSFSRFVTEVDIPPPLQGKPSVFNEKERVTPKKSMEKQPTPMKAPETTTPSFNFEQKKTNLSQIRLENAVVVFNLPPQHVESVVKSVFSAFGILEYGNCQCGDLNATIVIYTSPVFAIHALSQNGMKICGGVIGVVLAESIPNLVCGPVSLTKSKEVLKINVGQGVLGGVLSWCCGVVSGRMLRGDVYTSAALPAVSLQLPFWRKMFDYVFGW